MREEAENMMRVAKKLSELQFGQLMEVYEESNREKAAERYPTLSESAARLAAEQDFYGYLKDCFFRTPGAYYTVWEAQGRYVSAARLEPYRDGWLLEALETAPAERGRGYATRLLREVQAALPPGTRLYSHVSRKNCASLQVHRACGFRKILDHAVYVDGSVASHSVTLLWKSVAAP